METVFRHNTPPSPWPLAGLYFVVQTHGLFPWIVRRATHSAFDHAGIVTDPDGGIVEAEPGGVRRGHLSEYAGCRIALNSDEDMTVAQRAVVAEAALGMVGLQYNDLAIIDDGLNALRWHWRWLARHAATDGEVVCSQLVALAGSNAGLNWRCSQMSFAEVTPAMLARRPEMRSWSVPDTSRSG